MSKALVTGASKGIGREITLALARAGHTVVAAMRDPAGSDLAAVAAGENLSIILAELDVDDDASVARLFASEAAAPASLDILINNAGILSIESVEDETLARFQAVMNTNFFGTLRCTKAVIPAMRERGSGLIINISSISGRLAALAQGAYGASKFAVEAVTEILAQELAPFGVRVVLVEPGIISTPMTVANLPQHKADSVYPHARRMAAFFAETPASGPPPSVVSDTVLAIVAGQAPGFRHLCGPDAGAFIGMRSGLTDEAWIAMSDTMDDAVFFERFQAAMPA